MVIISRVSINQEVGGEVVYQSGGGGVKGVWNSIEIANRLATNHKRHLWGLVPRACGLGFRVQG